MVALQVSSSSPQESDPGPSRFARTLRASASERAATPGRVTHLAEELGVEASLDLGGDGEGGEPFELAGDLVNVTTRDERRVGNFCWERKRRIRSGGSARAGL